MYPWPQKKHVLQTPSKDFSLQDFVRNTKKPLTFWLTVCFLFFIIVITVTASKLYIIQYTPVKFLLQSCRCQTVTCLCFMSHKVSSFTFLQTSDLCFQGLPLHIHISFLILYLVELLLDGFSHLCLFGNFLTQLTHLLLSHLTSGGSRVFETLHTVMKEGYGQHMSLYMQDTDADYILICLNELSEQYHVVTV